MLFLFFLFDPCTFLSNPNDRGAALNYFRHNFFKKENHIHHRWGVRGSKAVQEASQIDLKRSDNYLGHCCGLPWKMKSDPKLLQSFGEKTILRFRSDLKTPLLNGQHHKCNKTLHLGRKDEGCVGVQKRKVAPQLVFKDPF